MQHDFVTATQLNKAHGRVEKRTIITSSLLQEYADWPYLQQVFKPDREVTHIVSGKHTHEVAYGITSLSAQEASPERLLLISRTHWHILKIGCITTRCYFFGRPLPFEYRPCGTMYGDYQQSCTWFDS